MTTQAPHANAFLHMGYNKLFKDAVRKSSLLKQWARSNVSLRLVLPLPPQRQVKSSLAAAAAAAATDGKSSGTAQFDPERYFTSSDFAPRGQAAGRLHPEWQIAAGGATNAATGADFARRTMTELVVDERYRVVVHLKSSYDELAAHVAQAGTDAERRKLYEDGLALVPLNRLYLANPDLAAHVKTIDWTTYDENAHRATYTVRSTTHPSLPQRSLPLVDFRIALKEAGFVSSPDEDDTAGAPTPLSAAVDATIDDAKGRKPKKAPVGAKDVGQPAGGGDTIISKPRPRKKSKAKTATDDAPAPPVVLPAPTQQQQQQQQQHRDLSMSLATLANQRFSTELEQLQADVRARIDPVSPIHMREAQLGTPLFMTALQDSAPVPPASPLLRHVDVLKVDKTTGLSATLERELSPGTWTAHLKRVLLDGERVNAVLAALDAEDYDNTLATPAARELVETALLLTSSGAVGMIHGVRDILGQFVYTSSGAVDDFLLAPRNDVNGINAQMEDVIGAYLAALAVRNAIEKNGLARVRDARLFEHTPSRASADADAEEGEEDASMDIDTAQ